ncbi:MAG: hypothetical protein ACM3QW_05430 [Ignavibacteriales bacterium]
MINQMLSHYFDVSHSMLFVTTMLAVTTMVFGIINMVFQRSHNKKSVKPFCNIHQIRSNDAIEINVHNAGLGPMVIKGITVIDSTAGKGTEEVPLTDILPKSLNYNYIINNKDKYVLAPLGELKLFRYTTTQEYPNEQDIDMIQNGLIDRTLCVRYQDIYDRPFTRKELIKF